MQGQSGRLFRRASGGSTGVGISNHIFNVGPIRISRVEVGFSRTEFTLTANLATRALHLARGFAYVAVIYESETFQVATPVATRFVYDRLPKPLIPRYPFLKSSLME